MESELSTGHLGDPCLTQDIKNGTVKNLKECPQLYTQKNIEIVRRHILEWTAERKAVVCCPPEGKFSNSTFRKTPRCDVSGSCIPLIKCNRLNAILKKSNVFHNKKLFERFVSWFHQ